MHTSVLKTDERIEAVYFTRDSLVINLMDGRTISAPLTWYPKLLKASFKERSNFEICGGGYGIHWPAIDEDLSVQGLLRGAPAPQGKKNLAKKKQTPAIKRARSTKKVKPS